MKKTIALLLTALLLCAALPVFAKAPPAVATEDGRITVEPSSAGEHPVVPLIDCDHSYGERTVHVTDQYACCEYRSYDEVYCAECGLFLKTRNLTSGTNQIHIGESVRHGPVYDSEKRHWIYTYTCSSCGADMGWRHAGF